MRIAICISCVLIVMAGCASTKKDEFVPGDRYAIAGFSVSRDISPSGKRARRHENKAMNQSRMLVDRALDTGPVADVLAAEFLGGFDQGVTGVRILSGRAVTSAAAYRRALSKVSVTPGFEPVKGYVDLSIVDTGHMKALADELAVDGVMMIYCDLHYAVEENEPDRLQPHMGVRVVVYDRSGRLAMDAVYEYRSARSVSVSSHGSHLLELRRTLSGYDARLAGMQVARSIWRKP
ncbi:MAG: hypothetical protein OEZ10_01920 [Gammaproteobacteria bacterium]|nr:hypothetical protein [Gammaproteobacteria bacterium]